MSTLLIDNVEDLVNRYIRWLKSKTILRQVDEEWVEIETPYVDRHNDFISVYIRQENNVYELNDGGYTIGDLKMSGYSFVKRQHVQILNETLNSFGVKIRENDMMYTYATIDTFAVRQHSLIQAILNLSDIFFTKTPRVEKLFCESVKDWLDKCKVRYTENIKICGKTGFDHVINFLIPQSKKYPERLVQAVSNPNKDSIQNVAFKWGDIRGEREGAKFYVVLNAIADNLTK